MLSPGFQAVEAGRGYDPDLWLVESQQVAAALAGIGARPERLRVVSSGVPLPDVAPVDGSDPTIVCVAGPEAAVADLSSRLLALGASEVVRFRRDVDSKKPIAVHVELGYGSLDERCERVLTVQAARAVCVSTPDDLLRDVFAPGAPVVGTLAAAAGVVAQLMAGPEHRALLGAQARRHVALRHEAGARAADLDEHYISLARTGRPAPQREPMPDWPTVSVVMPTFNRRGLLARSLDALEAQTYPSDRLQVVVVDDGSTDGTSEELGGRRPPWRFTPLRNDKNLLAAGARNRALAECTGEIVAFTDDDCRPRPAWLESLIAGFSSGVGGVQGRTVADPTQPLEPLSRTQWTPAEYGLYETANIAYRRSVLSELGPAPFSSDVNAALAKVVGPRVGNMAFAEDTDLAWRAKRNGAVTRFASTAVVEHHVYERDVRYLFRRALLAAGFPLLVRRVPELREVFLWRKVFLGPRHAALLAAVATAATVGRRRPLLAVAAAAPYVSMTVQPLRRGGRRARLRAAPVLIARDVVEVAALVGGSLLAKTPVL